jgi:hypothetical protein
MEIKETLVTPATAVKWLEGNTHNRAVRDQTVQRYSRDMKAGRWRLTHQGIAFGPDGKLLDGQHRLWAIVEADTAVKLMVARGVPDDVQAVIDDNLPRSAGDALKLTRGVATRTVEIAIAKRILADTLHAKSTRQECIASFLKHQAAIAFASACFPRMVRGVTIAPVMTPVARAFYTQDRVQLSRFAEILTDGRLNHDNEDAALTLRNWLLEGAPVRKAGVGDLGRDGVIYGKTERALAAFLNGERPAHLYAATTELFPLPKGMEDERVAVSRRLRIATPNTKKAAAK